MRTVTTDQTIILYDGWCSICTNTAAKLRRLDRNTNRLTLIDFRRDNSYIADHNLDPVKIRRVLHAITPAGQVLTAMDALRHTMKQVRRNKSIAWTALPILRPITDRLYLAFANNRHRLPGSHKSCPDGECSIIEQTDEQTD